MFVTVLDGVPSEVPALLLLVPITLASVLSSWRVGLPIALIAASVYGLLILPPIGTFHIGYTQEILIAVTFGAVAIVVSVLVSRRSIASRADLIGQQRMMLLRSVSHDLRNPLNSILGASTELYDGADYDEAARKRLLRVVIDETRRIDRIVDNLLGLSRLQAGALDPRQEPTSVSEMIEPCTSRFDLIGGPDDRLEVLEPLPDVDVDVDPVQMDQVLTNLVENAVRHGGSPVCVTIGGRRGGWFRRVSGPRRRRRLLRRGALEHVRAVPSLAADLGARSHDVPGDRRGPRRFLVDRRQHRVVGPPSGSRCPVRDERGTVVVIEDHRAQQEVLRAAFEARSQRVFVAGTGAAGLELVDTVNPTLVIIDLGLPDIDGLVLCRHVRARVTCPIIVVTAETDEARVVEALDTGADDYVTKPFSVAVLLARCAGGAAPCGPRRGAWSTSRCSGPATSRST